MVKSILNVGNEGDNSGVPPEREWNLLMKNTSESYFDRRERILYSISSTVHKYALSI
jgi:hypothetical protein